MINIQITIPDHMPNSDKYLELQMKAIGFIRADVCRTEIVSQERRDKTYAAGDTISFADVAGAGAVATVTIAKDTINSHDTVKVGDSPGTGAVASVTLSADDAAAMRGTLVTNTGGR